MAQSQIPNAVQRILIISFVLIFISTVVVLFVGRSVTTLHREIAQLETFLANAANVQPNFEQSLIIYTTNTQPVIDYLLALRPASEEDYIAFIAAIEAIEQKLHVKVNLQSIAQGKDTIIKADQKTLDYKVNFYGNTDMLIAFLKELEALPYYIKVADVYYADSSSLSASAAQTETNITMTIKLYIK